MVLNSVTNLEAERHLPILRWAFKMPQYIYEFLCSFQLEIIEVKLLDNLVNIVTLLRIAHEEFFLKSMNSPFKDWAECPYETNQF